MTGLFCGNVVAIKIGAGETTAAKHAHTLAMVVIGIDRYVGALTRSGLGRVKHCWWVSIGRARAVQGIKLGKVRELERSRLRTAIASW